MIKTLGIKIILVGTAGVLLLNACKDKAKDYASNDIIFKNDSDNYVRNSH